MDKSYTFDLIDPEDGTDEMLLQFTEEFLSEQKWLEGDVITFTTQEDSSVVLTNKTLKERDAGV